MPEFARKSLAAVQDFVKHADSSRSVQELFDGLVGTLRGHLGASAVSVWYRDPETGEKKVIASYIPGEEKLPRATREQFIRQTIEKMEARANTEEDSTTHRLFTGGQPIFSDEKTKIPIVGDTRNNAAIRIAENYGLRVYDIGGGKELKEEDKRLLVTIAELGGLAISRQHQLWLSRLQAFNASVVPKPGEYLETLQNLANEARKVFGGNAGVAIALRDKRGFLNLQANAGISSKTLEGIRLHLSRTPRKGQLDVAALCKLLNEDLRDFHLASGGESKGHLLLVTGVSLSPEERASFSQAINAALQHLDQIEDLAKHYSGLMGSPYFRQEIERFAYDATPEKSVGFLMGDARRFKLINDKISHAAGDDAIRAIGRVVQRSIAEVQRDLVGLVGGEAAKEVVIRAGNMGGDEFGILVYGLPKEQAELVLKEIQARIQRNSGVTNKAILKLLNRDEKLLRKFLNKSEDERITRADRKRIEEFMPIKLDMGYAVADKQVEARSFKGAVDALMMKGKKRAKRREILEALTKPFMLPKVLFGKLKRRFSKRETEAPGVD